MENGESSKRPHERLDVWRDSMDLVEMIYRLFETFPATERFGLMAQLRRAAVSIPANIAEGAARRSTPEYLRFLSIARGSLSEASTHLQIARRLDYTSDIAALDGLIDTIFAKLTALMNVLSKRGD
ncbi:four helix bundle protein [Xanthomonas sacchari]|uniref:four helix bundle protein n=1 Tax=Xanthomonas sacchari TaxID=56458 RepID=UPI002434B2D7|nr:four helix bundle protein [Xanthomonas sacchari]